MTKLMVILMALLTGVVAHAENLRRDSAIQSTVHLIGPRRAVRSNLQMWVIGSGGLSRLLTDDAVPANTTRTIKGHNVFGGGILVESGRYAMTGQTGVFYFQEGAQIATATSDSLRSQEGTLTIGYIGIPAIGRFNVVRKGRSRFSIGGGLMPAAVVSREAKAKYEEKTAAGVVTKSEEGSNNDVDGLRAVNVFGVASLGGDIGLNRDQDMRIEIAYRQGLLPTTNFGGEDSNKTFTSSLVMNLGFGFDI